MTEGKSVSAHRAQGQHPLQGVLPSPTVGLGRKPPSTHPPWGRALDPSATVGEWREASYLNPTSGRATPLTRGVALVHGGQRPISLEYQINRLPLSYLIL